MKTVTAVGPLTKQLEQIRFELDDIQEDLKMALRSLNAEKASFIEQAIRAVAPQVTPDQQIHLEGILEDTIADITREIEQARNFIGRLSVVTRNSLDITNTVEKAWWEKLRGLVEETRWYRERFPGEYERKQREKEYEHYRIRPETFFERPGTKELEELYRTRPELFKQFVQRVQPEASQKHILTKLSQLEELATTLDNITRRIFRLAQEYFGPESPLLEASNKTLGGIKSKQLSQTSQTLRQALGDQIQMIENLFGFEKQPGKYTEIGSKSFLMPAVQALQGASRRLQEPLQQPATTQKTIEQLKEPIEEFEKYRQWKPPKSPVEERPEEIHTWPTPETREMYRKLLNLPKKPESGTEGARINRLLERRSIIANRQRRCYIIQRIASSR